MASIPDQISVKRHVDLEGRRSGLSFRRAGVATVGIVLVLGLLGVFGQRPGRATVDSSAASVELFAPTHLRGGLLYEARFTIAAHRRLDHAVLQLAPGWAESQQINTIEPSPVAETSHDGQIALTLGTIPAGEVYRLWMEFQVDPTNVGRRTADAALYDGSTRLLTIHRTITIWP
jgi:hypothetical protein